MTTRLNLAAIFSALRALSIVILAIPFWFGVLFFAGDSLLLSRAFVVGVLIAMTVTAYVPIRRWPNAWCTAALFAGVIASLALLIAAAVADLQ